MKSEAQRIAIAEACGWKGIIDGQYAAWVSPDGSEYQVMFGWQTYKDGTDILPDYLNNLNAMHEAEKVCLRIMHDKGDDYAFHDFLVLVTRNAHPIHATAAQRAEAFLRTIGKWEH